MNNFSIRDTVQIKGTDHLGTVISCREDGLVLVITSASNEIYGFDPDEIEFVKAGDDN